MIELTNTLLPNLPDNLNWVYGVFYIIEGITFFSLLLSPLMIIFNTTKKVSRRKK